jgi:hypothetical protein
MGTRRGRAGAPVAGCGAATGCPGTRGPLPAGGAPSTALSPRAAPSMRGVMVLWDKQQDSPHRTAGTCPSIPVSNQPVPGEPPATGRKGTGPDPLSRVPCHRWPVPTRAGLRARLLRPPHPRLGSWRE